MNMGNYRRVIRELLLKYGNRCQDLCPKHWGDGSQSPQGNHHGSQGPGRVPPTACQYQASWRTQMFARGLWGAQVCFQAWLPPSLVSEKKELAPFFFQFHEGFFHWKNSILVNTISWRWGGQGWATDTHCTLAVPSFGNTLPVIPGHQAMSQSWCCLSGQYCCSLQFLLKLLQHPNPELSVICKNVCVGVTY